MVNKADLHKPHRNAVFIKLFLNSANRVVAGVNHARYKSSVRMTAIFAVGKHITHMGDRSATAGRDNVNGYKIVKLFLRNNVPVIFPD